jgi:hypothetical protein
MGVGSPEYVLLLSPHARGWTDIVLRVMETDAIVLARAGVDGRPWTTPRATGTFVADAAAGCPL